jgi:hypothetical protein
MRRRRWTIEAAVALAILAAAETVAAGPSDYLHAANCQEIGAGESGAIDRSFYRITNTGSQPKQVICHVPVGIEGTGSLLSIELNVTDHHSTGDVKTSICRRDRWGTALACDEVWTNGTEGTASLVLQLPWVAASYYTLVVELPPNGTPSSGNYTRFHTYRVVRH